LILSTLKSRLDISSSRRTSTQSYNNLIPIWTPVDPIVLDMGKLRSRNGWLVFPRKPSPALQVLYTSPIENWVDLWLIQIYRFLPWDFSGEACQAELLTA
jgi:hypothetical protein